MNQVALELRRVFKKFRKGETYDSLRDLIPALTGRLFKSGDTTLQTREFWAVNDVSFKICKGEAFGIIGPNGSGKSTILKLLSGVLQPTSGEISIMGKLSALIEIGAGFHPDLTGRENIFLNGTILGMTRNEIQRKLAPIIEFSGLGDFIDTPVKRYSSGMYARLGFSVAAHVDPEILLVDEVLSVGDYAFQRKCIEKMKSVVQSGATIIFIAHNLKAVSDLCPRSILLEHGRVLKEGRTDEIIRTYMDRASKREETDKEGIVHISSVRLLGKDGESVQFNSGDRAFFEVDIAASADCEQLAVVVGLTDDHNYEVFSTSTERMGLGSFSLEAGNRLTCSFQLDLMLADGTFHFSVGLFRHGTPLVYENWFPARTFYVNCESYVRGVVNLFPMVEISRSISSTTRMELKP